MGKRFLCSPKHADRLWNPDSLLFSEYWESFMGVKPRGCENVEVKKELS